MEVVPVIDLKGGVVVHAQGGRRDQYRPVDSNLSRSAAPLEVVGALLRVFAFRRLYVADLDAIGGGHGHQAELAAIAAAWPALEVWVDSGVGDAAAARAWFDRQVGNLVIGSESQFDTVAAHALCRDPRVVLSLDFRGDAFHGPPALSEQPELWPGRVIVMTLARVGAGRGPDLAQLGAVIRRAGDRKVYAAGGIRDAADLAAVAEAGAAGVLVASALHSGAIAAADIRAVES